MGLEISHIAYAFKDIQQIINKLDNVFDIQIEQKKEYSDFSMNSQKVMIGNSELELMEPNGKGIISDFIDRHGESFHHIAYRCYNLEEHYRELKNKGVLIIEDTKKPMEYFFIHPKSTGGILVEIHI